MTGGPQSWVMVPGTLCSARVFAPLLDALGVAQDRRKFLMADLPRAQDYAPVLDRAVAPGDIVFGFSLGALVLSHNIAALSKARAVVLLACNPFPDPPGNRRNREAVRDRILAGGARQWVQESWSMMSASDDANLREQVIAMAEESAHLIGPANRTGGVAPRCRGSNTGR